MNLSACWSEIGFVDIGPAVLWLKAPQFWPDLFDATKPQRLFAFPGAVFDPLIASVLSHFSGSYRVAEKMLSRMKPGQAHPLHVDVQHSPWVTRIHVPILTNPGAWMFFEEEGTRFHFKAGMAYTFDAMRRHAFANEGETERVHFIFDVFAE